MNITPKEERAMRRFESDRMEPPRGGRAANTEPTSCGPIVKSFIDNMRKRDGNRPFIWTPVNGDRWVIDYDAMYEGSP